MNRKLQRLLFIDDARLWRWGRLSGWFSILFSILLMIASPLVYFFMYQTGESLREAAARAMDHLVQHLEPGTHPHDLAIGIQSHVSGTAGLVGDLAFPVAVIVFGCGVLILWSGILYLRLRDLVAEPGTGGNAI